MFSNLREDTPPQITSTPKELVVYSSFTLNTSERGKRVVSLKPSPVLDANKSIKPF